MGHLPIWWPELCLATWLNYVLNSDTGPPTSFVFKIADFRGPLESTGQGRGTDSWRPSQIRSLGRRGRRPI